MKKLKIGITIFVSLLLCGCFKPTLETIKRDGVYNFPQKSAPEVFVDSADLRLSVYNDRRYLYVQAILWRDSDPSILRNYQGRYVADWSSLNLVLGDTWATPGLDRDYHINVWADSAGLTYQMVNYVRKDGRYKSYAPLKRDSRGKGCIRYVETKEKTIIRVDNFLIPLKEISKHTGEKIRFCYHAESIKPKFIRNSITDTPSFCWSADPESYHSYSLKTSRYKSIMAWAIPDGKKDYLFTFPMLGQFQWESQK